MSDPTVPTGELRHLKNISSTHPDLSQFPLGLVKLTADGRLVIVSEKIYNIAMRCTEQNLLYYTEMPEGQPPKTVTFAESWSSVIAARQQGAEIHFAVYCDKLASLPATWPAP